MWSAKSKIQALLPTTRTHNQTGPHGNTQRREGRWTRRVSHYAKTETQVTTWDHANETFTTQGKTQDQVRCYLCCNISLKVLSAISTCQKHAYHAALRKYGTKVSLLNSTNKTFIFKAFRKTCKGNLVSNILPVQSSRNIHQQPKSVSLCENHAKPKSNCCSHKNAKINSFSSFTKPKYVILGKILMQSCMRHKNHTKVTEEPINCTKSACHQLQ